MLGINASTILGDAFIVPTTSGAPAAFNVTPSKSLLLVIQAPTGTSFWVRQSNGSPPTDGNVKAKPADLVTTTGMVHLLDIARILDQTIQIYCSAAGVSVLAFTYHHGSTLPETGSVLIKTVMDKLLRVA